MKRLIGSAFAAASLLLSVPAVAAEPAVAWVKAGPTVPLTIRSKGAVHHFQVERALTPQAQEQGLMFRRAMPADHGMIFPNDPPRAVTYWMKNTYISLDLVFIGPDHRILQISADAKPLSEALIPCDGPVAAVLELNGGMARKLGIKPGDTATW